MSDVRCQMSDVSDKKNHQSKSEMNVAPITAAALREPTKFDIENNKRIDAGVEHYANKFIRLAYDQLYNGLKKHDRCGFGICFGKKPEHRTSEWFDELIHGKVSELLSQFDEKDFERTVTYSSNDDYIRAEVVIAIRGHDGPFEACDDVQDLSGDVQTLCVDADNDGN